MCVSACLNRNGGDDEVRSSTTNSFAFNSGDLSLAFLSLEFVPRTLAGVERSGDAAVRLSTTDFLRVVVGINVVGICSADLWIYSL